MFQRHANIIRGTGGRRAGLRPPWCTAAPA